jgi:glycosyltransferase involved in cell wall biosynthesis
MKDQLIASIIINNFNYGRFLSEAIDSALNQTYLNIEVIVVDDGSYDNSSDIIATYEDRIVTVLKQNGGQASALNKGFEASQGEIIFFLDADDIFLPYKVEEIVELFTQVVAQGSDALISNYISTINEAGQAIDINILDTLSDVCDWDYLPKIRGKKNKLIEGVITSLSTPEQAFQFAAKYRFIPFLAMPTSGFAMTRSLAQQIFPIPYDNIKVSADEFVVKAASLLGTVYLTNRNLTKYRIHGKNNWHGSSNKIPKEFFEILDEFLNSKLQMIGKKPVFSYFQSIHAKGYYRTNYESTCERDLFELAIRVITWHVNPTTIIFFMKTIFLSILLKLNRIGADTKTSNS